MSVGFFSQVLHLKMTYAVGRAYNPIYKPWQASRRTGEPMSRLKDLKAHESTQILPNVINGKGQTEKVQIVATYFAAFQKNL